MLRLESRTFAMFHVGEPDCALTVPTGMILTAYRGSIAHNMHDPNPDSIDDIDVIGFAVGDPCHYFGLQEWGSRGTRELKEGRHDAVWYEIRKAFSLLLQGNPNIISVLWIRPGEFIDVRPHGRRILDNRGLFVGKHVYNSFAGYAHAQLLKMESRDPAELREYLAVVAELKYRGKHPNEKGVESPRPDADSPEARNAAQWGDDKLIARMRHFQKKGENIGYMGDKRKRLVVENGYDSKNAAHCIRLLKMGKEFLESGAMNVFRTEDREELLSIKRGNWRLEDVKEYAEALFSEIRAARDRSALPDGPDKSGAEALLIDIVRESIGDKAAA